MKDLLIVSRVILSLCSFLFVSNLTFADTYDVKDLYVDVSLSPNVEVVSPFIRDYDVNGDGFFEKFSIQFDVYEAGTTNHLLRTDRRTVWAPLPCSNPVWTEGDWDVFTIAASEGIESVMFGGTVEVECEESGTGEWKESETTFFYAADIASGGGDSWLQTWKGSFGLGSLVSDGAHVVMIESCSDKAYVEKCTMTHNVFAPDGTELVQLKYPLSVSPLELGPAPE